jgi:hypothetical protein
VGWWFRCLQCPVEALVELSRADHERKKHDRQLEHLLDQGQRCGWCFIPHRQLGAGASSPACQCHRVRSAREVFAGL